MSSRNSSIITINSANSRVTNNNVFEFNLKSTIDLKNYEIGLVKAFLYNSLFNVDQALFHNTSYQYSFPNGAGFDVVTITMPSGFYDIENLNTYLQGIMLNHSHYIIDTNGDPVFFMTFNVNVVYYSITFTMVPIPSTLPAGYTLPAGLTLPATAKTPQLIILPASSNDVGFGGLVGLNHSQTLPPVVQATTYTKDSDFTGQISPQYAFNVCVNLVNQPFLNSVPSMIYPFSFTVPFGSQEVLDPPQYKFFTCLDSQYSTIVVRIVDQAGMPALLKDKNASFTLELRPIKDN